MRQNINNRRTGDPQSHVRPVTSVMTDTLSTHDFLDLTQLANECVERRQKCVDDGPIKIERQWGSLL